MTQFKTAKEIQEIASRAYDRLLYKEKIKAFMLIERAARGGYRFRTIRKELDIKLYGHEWESLINTLTELGCKVEDVDKYNLTVSW